MENEMFFIKRMPVIVMPPVYELPIHFWRWCKLNEICVIIPDLANFAGVEFAPTPEDLVSRFAGLVRLNRIPDHIPVEKREEFKKKIFRYSQDGNSFWGTEVPIAGSVPPGTYPPYVDFRLEIGVPYPKELFVPEGWAIDTLRAIRMGSVAAVDLDGMKIGFPPANSNRELIHLEGKKGLCLVKLPKCVQ